MAKGEDSSPVRLAETTSAATAARTPLASGNPGEAAPSTSAAGGSSLASSETLLSTDFSYSSSGTKLSAEGAGWGGDTASSSGTTSQGGSVPAQGGSGQTEVPSSNGDSLQRSGSSRTKLEGGEDVFVMENVGIHPSAAASQRIRGRLRLVRQESAVYLSWTPYTLEEHPRGLDPKARGQQYTIRAVALSEIRSIRRRTPQLGWQYVIFVLNTGLAFPPLYFYDGGVRAFIAALKQWTTLVKSQDEPGVYLVVDSDDPLMAVPRLHHDGAFADFSGLVAEVQSRAVGVRGLQGARSQQEAKDVPMQVLQGFAGITRLARQALGVGVSGARPGERVLGGADAFERMPVRELDAPRPGKAAPALAPAVAHSGVGHFELVDPLEEVLVATKPPPQDVGPPLSHEEWVTHLDSDGRVLNPTEMQKEIFKRGVEPELRREVWKFLLGYYSFDSTYAERRQLDEDKRKEQGIYKMQWLSVTPAQAKRFAKYRERVSRIEKDVVRTDRRIPQFEDDESPMLTLLRSILLTYSFYNFDLGFCQGMSDLASPFLVVMEDECEAFWCFAQFMETMGRNFNRDQTGMHAQLLALSKLLKLLDPPLFQYLESIDAANFFFCFRWLLILFKREWEFEEVLKLWERIWTCPMTKNFHLYICCAILKRFRRKIIDEQMQFETLVRFANELSCRLDLDDILQYAEALCLWAGQRGEALMPAPVEESAVLIEGPEMGPATEDD